MKRAFAIISIIILSLACLFAQVSTNATLQIKGYKNKTTTSTGSFTLSIVSYESDSVAEDGTITLDTAKHATSTSIDTNFFTWNLSRTYSSNDSSLPSSETAKKIGTITFTIGLLKSSYNNVTYNPSYSLVFDVVSATAAVFNRKSNKYYTYTPSLTVVSGTPENDSVTADDDLIFSGSVFSYDIYLTRTKTNNSTANDTMSIGGNGSILISELFSSVQNKELTYTAPVYIEFEVGT